MGNTIIKAYKDNLNFHQTLPKLHFTALPKLCQSCTLRSPRTLAKFIHPKMIQTLIQTFPKLFLPLFELWKSSSNLHPGQKWFKKLARRFKLCQSCILRSPRTLAKFIRPKIHSNFSKAVFYRPSQTLPKLHFTVLSKFGKVSSKVLSWPPAPAYIHPCISPTTP